MMDKEKEGGNNRGAFSRKPSKRCSLAYKRRSLAAKRDTRRRRTSHR
jgi:hypothetical protein